LAVASDTAGATPAYIPIQLPTTVAKSATEGVNAANRTLLVHSSQIPGALDALRTPATDVFLVVGGIHLRGDAVYAAMIVTSDGQVYFAGECADEWLTVPLHEQLGANADELLVGAVGKTGEAFEAALGITPPSMPEEPPALNPEHAQEELLDFARHSDVVGDLPGILEERHDAVYAHQRRMG
jgi:hypothetical protein